MTDAAGNTLAVAVMCAIAALHVGLGTALFAWGRRVGARQGGAWRWAAWAPLAALALPLCGCPPAIVALAAGASSPDAAGRATAIARGVAEALNAGTFAMVVAWGIYAAVALALGIAALIPRSR